MRRFALVLAAVVVAFAHMLLFSNRTAIALKLGSPPSIDSEPFSMGEFVSPHNLTWERWQKVLAVLAAELPKFTQCHANLDDCTSGERLFEDVVEEAKSLQGRAKIRAVNKLVNSRISFKSDRRQWNAMDVWSVPIVLNSKTGSFDTGIGDCEDYAIAKYVVFRRAGVARADVRILLVRDNVVHVEHAIVAVRDDKRWLILDNRWDTVYEDIEIQRYTPLVVLDARGVALLTKSFTMSDLIRDLAPIER